MTGALLIACFVADVTPPLGHPLCGGLVRPAERIVDALEARGFVLLGAGEPIVFCAVDWCELHNDAQDRWRDVLAEAAGTTPKRVMVATLHQHDAPLADLEARRMLEERGLANTLTDPKFHEQALARVAEAVQKAVRSPKRITHVGLGQGKVEKVASNRRIPGPDGKVHKMRGSSCTDAELIAAPEGTIDPWLKTLSFWDGEQPIAALSCYATHPMSYYRHGGVSCDFFGLARARRQKDAPAVFQIMTNGCGGNLGAGKYNDGSTEMRPILTDRLYRGMLNAWQATKRVPIKTVEWRVTPLRLPLKEDPRFSEAHLEKVLDDPKQALAERVRSATALSWIRRVKAGHVMDVSTLDLGVAQVVMLPGEPFVEYQLMAQKLRRDSFVMVVGFCGLGPGYVPIDRAYGEGGYEPGNWCFVGPGTETAMTAALRKALKVD
ncbi:MAG: hypothetical protein JXQ73_13490 [Phycisphaerae bacterium]|nr:hypothetical protein [Phycisphaerae bacterium]